MEVKKIEQNQVKIDWSKCITKDGIVAEVISGNIKLI